MNLRTNQTKTRRVFDIEANGLLDTVTRIHCIAIKCPDTGKRKLFVGPKQIKRALEILSEADEIWGHNIIGYDISAIQKVYPDWTYRGVARDTMVLTRLIWSDIKPLDFRRKGFPKKLIGKHTLEAWGHRLGEYKGDFEGPWEEYTDEMGEYCEQDVEVTDHLRELIEKQNYSYQAVQLEHEFAEIIRKQQIHGFHVNEAAVRDLYADLCEKRLKLENELVETFGPKITRIPFTPKRNDKKRGYVKGVPTEKVIREDFNPRSRKQIYERLMEQFGWKPKTFTDNGQPKVSEGILKKLPYPEAQKMAEFLMIQKRIGQIAEGKNGWLKLIKNGRIHGSVNTNGTPTGRCIHFKPNVSQTTAIKKPYGKEQRSCFDAGGGDFVLVGIDLAGIELRCLAHYLAKYDGGALVQAIIAGNNEDGTDMHSRNMKALQQYFPEATRDNAKTAVYALMYGASDRKLGSIMGKGKKSGAQVRKALYEGMTGLERLEASLQKKFSKRLWKKVNGKKKKTTPWLTGLDGRRIPTRSSHSKLNSLLQCAGAVIMKMVTVEFHRRLKERGYTWEGSMKDLYNPKWYAQQAHIHDEVQIKALKKIAEEVGQLFIQVTRDIGEQLNFRCPLDAEYKIGLNWAECH